MIPMQQISQSVGQLPRAHMLVALWNIILNIVKFMGHYFKHMIIAYRNTYKILGRLNHILRNKPTNAILES